MMLPSTRKVCMCVIVIALIISARSREASRCWTRFIARAKRTRTYTMLMEYLSPWLRNAREFFSGCLPQSQVDQSHFRRLAQSQLNQSHFRRLAQSQLNQSHFRRLPQSQVDQSHFRPCTVAVCTSAQEFNITGLIEKLKKMRPGGNVVFQYVELPYNDLDSFQLDDGLYDGVILCHSIHNRRFAVTDVLDALYDRFLPHATSLFGKEKVCVIVHDFPWPLLSSTTKTTDQNQESSIADYHARVKEAHMESFQVRQPTTFQCCDLAMICGKLSSDVEMDNDDQQLIETFVNNVHQAYGTDRNPKLNHAQIVGYVLPLVLGLAESVRFLRQIRRIVHEGRGSEANIMCDENGNEISMETDVEQDESEVIFHPDNKAILDVTLATQDTKESIEPSLPASAGDKQWTEYTDKPSNCALELGDSHDTPSQHHVERTIDQPPTGKEKDKAECEIQHNSKDIPSPGKKQQERNTEENIKEIFLQHLDIAPTLQDQHAMDTGHHNPRSSYSSELEMYHELIGRSTKCKQPEDLDSYENTFIQHHRTRALDMPPTFQEQYINSSARSRSSHQKTQCLFKSKL